jgi:lysine-specific demethylase 8
VTRGATAGSHAIARDDDAPGAAPIVRPLPRVAAASRDEFFADWVGPRRPAVFTGLVREWPAVRRWSVDALADAHPDVVVTTARLADGVVVMDRRRGLLQGPERLAAFVAALRAGTCDRYVMAPLDELPATLRADAPPPTYLDGTAVQSAKLWIGSAGTVSGLHFDLADNLHAQVSGRKRFTLVAPEQSACVYPNSFFDGVPNGCRVDVERPDYARHPRLRDAALLVAELEPGDVIYIPRGWWHHVRTLELGIAVNFWWARGVRRLLVQAADYVKRVRRISR